MNLSSYINVIAQERVRKNERNMRRREHMCQFGNIWITKVISKSGTTNKKEH